MSKKREELFVGDVIDIKKSLFNNMEWVNLPEELVILEIIDKSQKNYLGHPDTHTHWLVARINGIYSDSLGNHRNEILLEHLTRNKKATRNLTIDRLLDPDESDESDIQ